MSGWRGIAASAILLIILLLLTLFFNAFGFSLAHLGLSRPVALLLLCGALAGSVINVPVCRSRRQRSGGASPQSWFYYQPPRDSEPGIAVNVGGALIPCGVAVYLLAIKAPPLRTLVVFLGVAAASWLFSRPRPHGGVSVLAAAPPIVAVALALLVARQALAPAVFSGGVLGTVAGAGLRYLPAALGPSDATYSIGGAGVFEAVFLVAMVAVILA